MMAAETYWKVRRMLGSARFRLTQSALPRHFIETGSLFVHIPKAAGISISRALYGVEVGHRSFRDYLAIDRRRVEKLFTFSVVRNPWDRFVSAYYFLSGGGMPSHPADAQFARSVISRFSDINHFAIEWLSPRNAMSYHHFIPQAWFLRNASGEVDLRFIARFEALERDFAVIADAVGCKATLARTNSTNHPRHDDALSAEAREAVGRVYADDAALFGY